MNPKAMAHKNLVLGMEFDKYLLEHPDLLARIPQGAHVVLLPTYDPALLAANRRLARKRAAEGRPIVFVTVAKLAPPPKSRLIRPRLSSTERAMNP
ncbi:MAG: DUF5647 family protein [Candidatus Binatia bacterium]